MLSDKSGHSLHLSPESFAVVLLAEGEMPWGTLVSQGCLPLNERTFLAPESVLEQLPPQAQVASSGWRRVEVSGSFAHPELLAAAASALAEVEVPFLVVSRTRGLWLFVPQPKLGRALAALRQARLERFAPFATDS